MAEEIDVFQSSLVPKHEILSEGEKKSLLDQIRITESQLPKMKSSDPAAAALGAKKGDVIRIMRKSQTAGEHFYYRLVVA